MFLIFKLSNLSLINLFELKNTKLYINLLLSHVFSLIYFIFASSWLHCSHLHSFKDRSINNIFHLLTSCLFNLLSFDNSFGCFKLFTLFLKFFYVLKSVEWYCICLILKKTCFFNIYYTRLVAEFSPTSPLS